jgi:hypothetical protein
MAAFGRDEIAPRLFACRGFWHVTRWLLVRSPKLDSRWVSSYPEIMVRIILCGEEGTRRLPQSDAGGQRLNRSE